METVARVRPCLAALVASALLAACDDLSPPAAAPPPQVVDSPLAGRWYPADPTELAAWIDGASRASKAPDAGVHALVLPHAGYRWSGEVALRALGTVYGRRFDLVVVMGPSHHVRLEDAASVPHATHVRTPLGLVPIATDVVERLERHPEVVHVPDAHEEEHSVDIELPLLQRVLAPGWRLVPLVVGRLGADVAGRLAAALAAVAAGDTLVVASTDFTHYGPRFGYVPFTEDVSERIRALDRGAWERAVARDADGFRRYVEDTGATICGRDPVEVLLRMLPADATGRLVASDTSARVAGEPPGPGRDSVSYVGLAYRCTWPRREEPVVDAQRLGDEERKTLLVLARGAIRYALENLDPPDPSELGVELTPILLRPSGAFVTLRRGGQLRGCIGEIHPRRPLWRCVMGTAVSAALQDRRFVPVGPDELEAIAVHVSVLTPPTPIADWREIELGRHGIVLEKEGRAATFLPQVAPEQGWDLEQTLTHLARKAGLASDAWRDGARFLVFEAEVFGEEGE